MKPSITPEELIRMQGLAERLLAYVDVIHEDRRSAFLSALAPFILGEWTPLQAMPPCAPFVKTGKRAECEHAFESILWASFWAGMAPDRIKGHTAVTFNLNCCETHLDKFDSLI